MNFLNQINPFEKVSNKDISTVSSGNDSKKNGN